MKARFWNMFGFLCPPWNIDLFSERTGVLSAVDSLPLLCTAESNFYEWKFNQIEVEVGTCGGVTAL